LNKGLAGKPEKRDGKFVAGFSLHLVSALTTLFRIVATENGER
jgi:hypothetical protein